MALVGAREFLNTADVGNAQDVLNSLSPILGKALEPVGSPLTGQALFHIDLYMRPLPNGTLLIDDYRKGLNVLQNLSEAEWDTWMEEQKNIQIFVNGLAFSGMEVIIGAS